MNEQMERLYEAARALHGVEGQSAVARLLNASPQTLKNWESRGVSKNGMLTAERTIGCSALWIESGEGEMLAPFSPLQREVSNVASTARPVLSWEHEEELSADEYVFIPRLTVEASCGDGKAVWHIDEKGQRNAFRRSWAERLGINPEKCATIVASGDSMEERICDGDSLVLDYTQGIVLDGKVYAITYSGEVFVKRLFKRIGGGIRIVSDNLDKTRYPDWDVTPEQMEHLQVIGRIVAISGGM